MQQPWKCSDRDNRATAKENDCSNATTVEMQHQHRDEWWQQNECKGNEMTMEME